MHGTGGVWWLDTHSVAWQLWGGREKHSAPAAACWGRARGMRLLQALHSIG